MNNTVFWSWNNKIEKSDLEKQIISMSDGGINGFFIHARGGLKTKYMDEEWMDAVAHCVDLASRVGIEVWLYDEKGWPSGSAGGNVEALGEEYEGKKLCASFNFDEKFANRVIARYKRVSDDYFEQIEGGDADLWIYYELVGNSDRMYADCGKAFLRLTHDVYKSRLGKYFGNGIKGIFFDEPGVHYFWPDVDAMAWSVSIPAAYKREYGESIEKDLWRLFFDVESSWFRSRYVLLCGKLFSENFIAPMVDWCKENGLILTGHFCMEEAMHTSLKMSGSVMDNYVNIAIPGIDFLGRRNPSPVLVRQVSSIANQFDKDTVMCEIFGATGYDMTFTELLSVWRQFGVRGVNMPCYHLFAYSTEGDRKYDFPGFFSPQATWYKSIKSFNDEMSFINKFASLGKEYNEVLILNPNYSLSGCEVESVKARKISSDFRQLLEELEAIQVDYDLLDEMVAENFGSVENGAINIGKRVYKLVIVPKCVSIKRSTLELLKKFCMQGGRVLFVRDYPHLVDYKESKELEEFVRGFAKTPFMSITFAKRKLLYRALGAVKYKRKVEVKDLNGDLASGISVRLAKDDKGLYLTVVNVSGVDFIGNITVCETKTVYGVNSRGEFPISFTVNSDGLFFPYSISAGGAAYFVLDGGELKEKPRFVSRCTYVRPSKLVIDEDNYAVLDKLSVSVAGGDFGEETYAEKVKIPCGENIRIKYSFNCKEPTDKVSALIETNSVSKVEINGKEITESHNLADGTGRTEYVLNDTLIVGCNELIVYYACTGERGGERADCVLLKGKFSVETENLAEYVDYYTADGWSLTDGKDNYDATLDFARQGRVFYAGKALYEFIYESCGGDAKIGFSTHGITACDVSINGEFKFTASDLSALYDVKLKRGKNIVQIIVHTTDANIYGPFHNREGFPKLTSPGTYSGKWGITENVLYPEIVAGEIYDGRYHIKKFSMRHIKIVELCEE